MFIHSLTHPLSPPVSLSGSLSGPPGFHATDPPFVFLGADTWVQLVPSLLVAPLSLSSLLPPRDPSPPPPSPGLVLPRDAAGEEAHLLHHPHGRPRLRVLRDRPPGLLRQGMCPSHAPSPNWDLPATHPPLLEPSASLGVTPIPPPPPPPCAHSGSALTPGLSLRPKQNRSAPLSSSLFAEESGPPTPGLAQACVQLCLLCSSPFPRYTLRRFPLGVG